MKVKDLKLILAAMDDDADVFARDRDCIGLYMVDVVGHPSPVDLDLWLSPPKKYNPEGIKLISYHNNISDVYGGGGLDKKVKQAIIFCDND